LQTKRNEVNDSDTLNSTLSLPQALEQLRGVKILLVEDNEINREIAYEILNEEQIHVDCAANGEEALDMLKSNQYDGILMDCMMPVMDGYQATREIRKQQCFKDLPIIALTANALTADIDKILQAGMNDRIVKPIDYDSMFQTMATWIKKNTAA
jgi:two-component system sensor histidine kinase/response regulator